MNNRDETLLRSMRGAASDDTRVFTAKSVRVLIGIIDANESQLARIKAAMLHAGCADWTDDVAQMFDAYMARETEEA
jgi:hypothetical protein